MNIEAMEQALREKLTLEEYEQLTSLMFRHLDKLYFKTSRHDLDMQRNAEIVTSILNSKKGK